MAEEVWMVQTKKADFNRIAERFGIDPVTARIIRNRGIEGEDRINLYLNGTVGTLYDPRLMKDMEKAAAILKDKIDRKKKDTDCGRLRYRRSVFYLHIIQSVSQARRSCGLRYP